MQTNTQKIIIPLKNGNKLVVEQGSDPDYPYEVYIGVMEDDDAWYQGLASVRSAYHYKGGEPVFEDDKFDVLVWADENDEDYTDEFQIGLYHEFQTGLYHGGI